MKTRRGFTLVEMMTVMVIIGILAAVTMKLMVLVNHKMGRGKAAAEIERVKHALVEYHAVYGIFPPVTTMAWEYEKDTPPAVPDDGMGFSDGLATYLFNDPQNKRWASYMDGLKTSDIKAHKGNNASFGVLAWSNNWCTIQDPWERDYVYITADPYQSFRLFSTGPDGKTNTADDIGVKFNE